MAAENLEDIFTVTIYSTAAFAKLANDQLDTMAFSPHVDVIYTLGDGDVAVAAMAATFKRPVDTGGFNDFSGLSLPTVIYTLEYLSGSTWTAITAANF